MADLQFVKCQTCGGIYPPLQADGSEYYHACSPTVIVTPAVMDATGAKVVTPAVIAKRAVIRNENVKVDPDTGKVSIISDGAGVVPVTDKATLAALTAAQGV